MNPTAVFWAILGGTNPGVFKTMQFVSFGPKQPIFPIGVRCSSFQEAQDVMKLEDVARTLDDGREDGLSVARAILQIPGILDVLSHRVAFFPVVYGQKPGIYEDWAQAKDAIGAKVEYPRWRKATTLRDALVIMILKGNNDLIETVLPLLQSPQTPQRLDKHAFNLQSDTKNDKILGQPISQPVFAHSTPSFSPGRSQPDPNKKKSRQGLSLRSPAEVSSSSDVFLSSCTSSLSISATPDRKGEIYQYQRSLTGITGVLYEAQPSDPDAVPLPSLGHLADQYIQAHGYDNPSVLHIHYAYQCSEDVDAFLDYLVRRGLARREASFLWTLINESL